MEPLPPVPLRLRLSRLRTQQARSLRPRPPPARRRRRQPRPRRRSLLRPRRQRLPTLARRPERTLPTETLTLTLTSTDRSPRVGNDGWTIWEGSTTSTTRAGRRHGPGRRRLATVRVRGARRVLRLPRRFRGITTGRSRTTCSALARREARRPPLPPRLRARRPVNRSLSPEEVRRPPAPAPCRPVGSSASRQSSGRTSSTTTRGRRRGSTRGGRRRCACWPRGVRTGRSLLRLASSDRCPAGGR